MANNPWSQARKDYIRALIPNTKIVFANVDRNGTAHFTKPDKNSEIIIGYCEAYDVYFACNAQFHTRNTQASFECVSKYFSITDKINFDYKNMPNYEKGKECIIIIPNRKIEEFGKHFNYYFEKLKSKK